MRLFSFICLLSLLSASLILSIFQSEMKSRPEIIRTTRTGRDTNSGVDASRLKTSFPDSPPVLWKNSLARAKLFAMDDLAFTNIRPQDYVGPEACKECHKNKYDSWSKHPHRWMNAIATDKTVKGDFDDFKVEFMGGTILNYKHGNEFRVRLERDGIRHTFRVTQTVGSRIFQFYVGRLIEGPEPHDYIGYKEDHVIYSGWRTTENKWMPASGVGFGDFDHNRKDPYVDSIGANYAKECMECHTTIPLGELILRRVQRSPKYFEKHVSNNLAPFSFFAPGYLTKALPDLFPDISSSAGLSSLAKKYLDQLQNSTPEQIAVTRGISCEACHHGNRAHVENPKILPGFIPQAPEFLHHAEYDRGRTSMSKKLACSRCHAAQRPTYAAGMPVYNSAELSELHAGSCYSTLTCTDCHDPHVATGAKWSLSPDQDDALCLQCHSILGEEIPAHTHHQPGSEGSRCMNCHMPRIIEGLDKVTRTHAIFSPTNPKMLYSGGLNACNLCHLDKPMQWTIGYLNDWYDTKLEPFAEDSSGSTMPSATQWLRSGHDQTQLSALHAVATRNYSWALPDALNVLNSSNIVIRALATTSFEKLSGVPLSKFGYYYYEKPPERFRALEEVRGWLESQRSAGQSQEQK